MKEPSSPAIRQEARRLAADRICFEIERSSGKARENLRRVLETPVFSGLNEAPEKAEPKEGGDGDRRDPKGRRSGTWSRAARFVGCITTWRGSWASVPTARPSS